MNEFSFDAQALRDRTTTNGGPMTIDKLQGETTEKLRGAWEVYRDTIRTTADNMDKDIVQKRQEAAEAYQRHVETVSKEAGKWSAALDTRGAELERALYQGKPGYIERVRDLTGKTPEQLQEAAKIARKVDDRDTLRAAAVVAYEKGESGLFDAHRASDPELPSSTRRH